MGSHWSDKPVRPESMLQMSCIHDTFSSVGNPMLLVLILAIRCSCCAVTGPPKLFCLDRIMESFICLHPTGCCSSTRKQKELWQRDGTKGGSWGSFWSHITHICAVVLCHCAWLFHTHNTSASAIAIKEVGKMHVNNFLIANLVFYLLLFIPHEIWLLIGKSLVAFYNE